MEQIPILLLGTAHQSPYLSLAGVMPRGQSAQVAGGGGGEPTARNVHVIRSTEKEEGRLRKVATP